MDKTHYRKLKLPTEVEDWIWAAIEETANVCPNVTRTELLGRVRTAPVAHARYTLATALRMTVYQRTTPTGLEWRRTWHESPGRGWKPISYVSLGSLFGRHHSTFVVAHRNVLKRMAHAYRVIRRLRLRYVDAAVAERIEQEAIQTATENREAQLAATVTD